MLLSYSVVKEPTSTKGRQSCQTLTSVSSGLVPLPVNPTRLMRTRSLSQFAAWKRSAGSCDFHSLQGPGILRSRRHLVNYHQVLSSTSRPASLFHAAGSATISVRFGPAAQVAVQVRVISRLPKIPNRAGTSQNDPRVGPIPLFSVSRIRVTKVGVPVASTVELDAPATEKQNHVVDNLQRAGGDERHRAVRQAGDQRHGDDRCQRRARRPRHSRDPRGRGAL